MHVSTCALSCSCREEALGRLLTEAGSQGWRAAVDRECGSSLQLHRYATDPREADCLRLLPGINRRRALFLGNSLAILPFLLAEGFESVVVADGNARRLAFAHRRREEEAVKNLTCVSSEAVDEVMNRGGHFDLVVLGEECPEAAVSVPVADSRTPWRLCSLIADAGCLMYGVRFRLFQPLAKRLGEPWRPSAPVLYPAHARLLTAAKFSTVQAYWRRPDSRPYQMYVPLDSPDVIAYWLRNGPRPRGVRAGLAHAVADVARRLDFFPHLVNNFLIISRRG